MCWKCNRKRYLKAAELQDPEEFHRQLLLYQEQAKIMFPRRGSTCEKIGNGSVSIA